MTWAPCPHGVRTRGKKKDQSFSRSDIARRLERFVLLVVLAGYYCCLGLQPRRARDTAQKLIEQQ